jgi:hypothetical protein
MLLKISLCLLALCAFVNGAKINLGRGASMAIACATQMTNAGATNRVVGDTVSPGGADSGFGLVVGGPIVKGSNYWNTADGPVVTGDCANAATTLNGLPSLALASAELKGTHIAGVWKTGADCTVTGAMVLDAQNVADAQFVFIIGGTLTVGLIDTPFTITVINGGSSCNVFFTVAGKIDINPGSAVHGSFISQRQRMCSPAAKSMDVLGASLRQSQLLAISALSSTSAAALISTSLKSFLRKLPLPLSR